MHVGKRYRNWFLVSPSPPAMLSREKNNCSSCINFGNRCFPGHRWRSLPRININLLHPSHSPNIPRNWAEIIPSSEVSATLSRMKSSYGVGSKTGICNSKLKFLRLDNKQCQYDWSRILTWRINRPKYACTKFKASNRSVWYSEFICESVSKRGPQHRWRLLTRLGSFGLWFLGRWHYSRL